MLGRNIAKAVGTAKSFEFLLNRFTKPDELFGNYSVVQLEHDKYAFLVIDSSFSFSFFPNSYIV